jgi:glycosyltransferase involved in cell wall biosynthesis
VAETASAEPGKKLMLRTLYRLLTYSPIRLLQERKQLKKVLRNWHGDHLFLFPYLHIGGAEQVHADIAASIAHGSPLIIIHGFSKDRALLDRFKKAGAVLEIPRLLNHPLTRHKAYSSIAQAMNRKKKGLVFGSLSGVFHELLPLLENHVRTIYLQHAFLFQPEANRQQRNWLPQIDRVDYWIFVSRHAMDEFAKFLFANDRKEAIQKLCFIPNAVDAFKAPVPHKMPGVLFVGRESSEKRLDLFLRIAQTVDRRLPAAYRFTAVGPKVVQDPVVRFTGQISDRGKMSTVYEDHDVLVITSDREGFPLVLQEAMAHGLAIISTPVGDIPNRLGNDGSIITSSIDAEKVINEMTGALIKLHENKTLLETMRNAAFQKALREFQREKFNQNYRSLLIDDIVPT